MIIPNRLDESGLLIWRLIVGECEFCSEPENVTISECTPMETPLDFDHVIYCPDCE